MILYLDTSKRTCNVWVDDKSYSWESDRDLARGLLKFLKFCISESGGDWGDLRGLAFMAGPGSFTGLRIGVAVLNTIADSENIPIVATIGDNWRGEAKKKIDSGENEKIALPYYGHDANITTPKK
jgi:universal bacterial protein YeaZ